MTVQELEVLSLLRTQLKKLPMLEGAHYINIYVRMNGRDWHYEADYLKHVQKGLGISGQRLPTMTET